MAEDPQPMTLQQRIASLNAAHVGRLPGAPPIPSTRPKPQIPDRRPVVKQKSFNIPNESNVTTTSQPDVGNTPSGPPPLPSRKKPPPLPTRKNTQSSQEERRDSASSQSSNGYNAPRLTTTRTKSDENRIKAPAWGEVELPPLPAKVEPKSRTKSFTERPQVARRTPSISSTTSTTSAVTTASSNARQPVRPPLPSRKSSSGSLQPNGARKLPPLPSNDALERAKKAAFTSSSDHIQPVESIPSLPVRRPTNNPTIHDIVQSTNSVNLNGKPPPIPQSSKPDLSAIQATKPKLNGHTHTTTTTPPQLSNGCLICRDFSAPDHHATLFPRQHVTSLSQLAHNLTSPFPSPTDKARTIFTWLHHNISYNVQDFFTGNVQSSTPQSTLQTGLAVCEGYASLFTTIATHAGLESIVIGGHGKGFGYTALPPNSPIPPYSAGHAWNAVRIDNNEWKLIDCTWGAGHVQGHGQPYVAQFSPERFTQSNEDFAVDHFPENKNHFFLPGGRTLSWQEYITINPANYPYPFERPTFFDNAKTDYSIGRQTVCPPNRYISVSRDRSESIRFQFSLFCPHWSLERDTRKGSPPVFVLAVPDPRDSSGPRKRYIPLEYIPGHGGGGGDTWFVDVLARELGRPGDSLTLFAVKSFGDREDARGLTVREFLEGVGRVGMGFVGVSGWELVG